MNTSEVLYKAADLIEERGWMQGPDGWHDAVPELCLEGALAAGMGMRLTRETKLTFYACPAYAAVADYLGREPLPAHAPTKDSLWEWNDADERTVNEVVEALRAAAVIEAAKENSDTREPVSA